MVKTPPLSSTPAFLEGLNDLLGEDCALLLLCVLGVLFVAALITIGFFIGHLVQWFISRSQSDEDECEPYGEEQNALTEQAGARAKASTDDGALVAAITAAVAAYLEAEAAESGREAPSFRVVAFRRSWNRNDRCR